MLHSSYRLLDVEFLDGGDAVSYCTWTYYVFDADRSAPGVAAVSYTHLTLPTKA